MTLLSVTNLSKSYFRGDVEVPVLAHVALEIKAGEQVAVVGPSGVGKSTLLHLLGALDRPTSGDIIFKGTAFSSLSSDALASLRNLKIGFVFQSHHLLPEFSALENVLMPAHLAGVGSDAEVVTRAKDLLKSVGLSHRIEHRPGELSGGECQRVAVARALINNPELLIADEPTGNLDGEAAHALQELLEGLSRERNSALVVATHNLDFAHAMDRVIALRNHSLHSDPPTFAGGQGGVG